MAIGKTTFDDVKIMAIEKYQRGSAHFRLLAEGESPGSVPPPGSSRVVVVGGSIFWMMFGEFVGRVSGGETRSS